LVTTSQDSFINGNQNPYFGFGPHFKWPVAIFPEQLTAIRSEAVDQGNFFENEDSTLQFRCEAADDGWNWWSWGADDPWDSTRTIDDGVVEYENETVLFFDGRLQLFGEEVDGETTIGSSGDICLMDNLVFSSINIDNLPDFIPDSTREKLGVVSENDIFIADTWRNGRGNGLYEQGGRHERKNIVITAALLSLNERFTFEHQNDEDDDYVWCDPEGEHQGERDERGTIFLRGSIAQNRRGYVHRSNCGGTGYAKDFYYDFRLLDNPPPIIPQSIGKAVFQAIRPGMIPPSYLIQLTFLSGLWAEV